MRLSVKRFSFARSGYAASRSTRRSFLSVTKISSAVGVVIACGLSAGCSTVGDTGVATASIPAAQTPVVAAQSASSVRAAPISANGTDRPYVLAGKTYTPRSPRAPGKVGVGLASWYGGSFHGRRTANGETFDMAGFTAAHPTLPLPSYVRVTNVQNGRSMVVRVNDRGPFHKNRLIDVSKRTAETLGFSGAGVGNVKVDYIGPAPATRDDRRMLATYQEFGRPAAPQGVQVASLAPVSDATLMAEAGTPSGVVGTLVATATNAATVAKDSVVAVATSIPLPGVLSAPKSSPIVVASAKPAAVRSPAQPEPELASVGLSKPVDLPKRQQVSPEAVVALAKPTAPASFATSPTIAVASGNTKTTEAPHKRVVQPATPVLASSTPELTTTTTPTHNAAPSPSVNVASRIASSFDAFDGSNPFGQSSAPAAPGLAYNGAR